MKQKIKLKLNRKGFSLIEVVLVMMITVIAFTGIYSLFGSTVKYNADNRREIIAANLVQEGVELIRNRRDDLALDSLPLVDEDAVCNPVFPSDSADVDCRAVTYNLVCLSNHYYNSDDCGLNINTGFKRDCNIDKSGTIYKISCIVSWDSLAKPGVERSVTANSTLTDWQ